MSRVMVTINYDDGPEDVARKFLKALKEIGVKCFVCLPADQPLMEITMKAPQPQEEANPNEQYFKQ